MRPLAIAAIVTLLLLPTVVADTETGSTVGLNLGYATVGLWDIVYYAHPGGTAVLNLTWIAPGEPFIRADYDLRLYKPTALNDGVLLDSEMLAESGQRSYTRRWEEITTSQPANTYIVAIVTFQVQNEAYTLRSGAGNLQDAGKAPGWCISNNYCEQG